MNIILSFILLLAQTDIPFKPNDEFEIKVDYQVKKRPAAQFNAYGAAPANNYQPLPYIILNVKVLKITLDESKVTVSSNLQDNLFNKKIEEGTIVKLDLGFIEDVKNRTTAHAYVINFLDPKKVVVQRILIQIDKDGVFNVNNEKRGQF